MSKRQAIKDVQKLLGPATEPGLERNERIAGVGTAATALLSTHWTAKRLNSRLLSWLVRGGSFVGAWFAGQVLIELGKRRSAEKNGNPDD
jgi:hypothetical protein